MLRFTFSSMLCLVGMLGVATLFAQARDTPLFGTPTQLVKLNDTPSCNAEVIFDSQGDPRHFASYDAATNRLTLLNPELLENPPLRRAMEEHECGHYARTDSDPFRRVSSFNGNRFIEARLPALEAQEISYKQELAADCYAGTRLNVQGDEEAITAFGDYLYENHLGSQEVPVKERWKYQVSHPPHFKRIEVFLACAGRNNPYPASPPILAANGGEGAQGAPRP